MKRWNLGAIFAALAVLTALAPAYGQQQDDPTASQIFKPSDNDYAIDVLKRLFGESVTILLGGDAGGTTGSAILPVVIGTFNVAILFFGTIVAGFMMYQLVLDTARDGEAGGRDNNLAVTALRAGFGAAMLLPVKGGFSVIQILVIQMLILGSGLADTVWSTVANQMQTNATYTASTGDRGDSFVTAQKLSSVLATRVSGYLCMLHANNISNTLGTGAAPLAASSPKAEQRFFQGEGLMTAMVWSFQADIAYDSRSQMCGSTVLATRTAPRQAMDNDIYTAQATFAESLEAMTAATVQANAERAVTNLDSVASDIAQKIFAGQRDTATYKRQIKDAIAAETARFITGITASVTTGPNAQNINDLKRSFLEATTDDGWMFAATWQRALAAYVTKLNAARNELQFFNSMEFDPKAAGTSVWGSLVGYGDTEKRLFAAVDADFDYVKNLDGAFIEAGEPNPSDSTTLERVAANNQEQSSILSMQWLYSWMFNASRTPDESNMWNDPLVEIQELGQATTLVGGGTVGASGLLSAAGTAGTVISAAHGNILGMLASQAAGYVSDMISYLGYALIILGLILAIMLPFLPFVYFLSGAIGWIIMAIEAVIAAPLWILLAFAPHKGGDVIGTNKQGLMLMIGVFLRPVLLVLGLLACFLVMRLGLNVINIMFTGIYMVVAINSSVTNLFLGVGLIAMYVLALITLVSNCSALITGLGDAIMEFVGIHVGNLGRNTIANAVEDGLNPMGRSVGSMQTAVGQMGARTRQLGNPEQAGRIAGQRFLTRSRGPGGNGGKAGK